ncbi:MAG: DMT family transporter [Thermaerobacter sp.]|nr:DMT family transporter [Thermaerobacter sp.]
MSTLSIVLVVASGFVHALWNLWAKRSENPLLFLWSFQWVALAVYAPFAWWSLRGLAVSGAGVAFLALTIALHGIYVLLLSRSYALADLSQVYPLMRGTSPLFVPLLGVLLLGEHLRGLGWLGVALIAIGVLTIGGGFSFAHARHTAIQLGLAVGLAIASYTLVDKVTLHYIPAIALNTLSSAGNLAVLTIPALRTGRALAEWRHSWRSIAAAGILSPLSYLLFLWALTHAPVAALAPMRELGIVFGTVLGIYVLREPGGRHRILGAALITAGAIALGLGA